MLTKSEVKYIQSLSQKKERDENGVFLVEGTKMTLELMRTVPHQIVMIYAAKAFYDAYESLFLPDKVKVVSEDELFKISQLQTPQQVVVVVKQEKYSCAPENCKGWILALDGIRDPGNMGTIIRNADWFGIEQVLCSNDCVDIYNPKVVQASMGSVLRVRFSYTDLTSFLKQYKHTVVAATLDGVPMQSYQFPGEGILVIGNEGKGIREEVLSSISQKITIPSFGDAESLNAGVASGIVLWELRRKG
jgi:TrmH family RNA methyltransferase